MTQVGIISDSHGFIPDKVFEFLKPCDEVWHAGDWGTLSTYESVANFKPLRTVYGNIDGQDLRIRMPEILTFEIEQVKVCMLHIGGYPGRYSPLFQQQLRVHRFNLMVCGHSHILKALKDQKSGMLHLNPGAVGIHGFHLMTTAMRVKIEKGRIFDLEIWEQKKSSLTTLLGNELT